MGQKRRRKSRLIRKLFSRGVHPHDNSPNPEIEREITTQTQPTEKIQAFTLQELTLFIKKLQLNKAPGPDLITALMLKEMPREGYQTLLYIFNAIRRLQYWPAPLIKAKIIMVLKPGKNPTDVASYRPISILSILSKTLEKLLIKRYTVTQTYRTGYLPTKSAFAEPTQQYNNATALQTQ